MVGFWEGEEPRGPLPLVFLEEVGRIVGGVRSVEAGEMELGLRYMRLPELREWEMNPKLHDLEGLAAAFKVYGFAGAIVVNERDGRILAGHGQCRALRAMQRAGEEAPAHIRVDEDGEWLVPVLTGIFMDEETAHAFGIDDNLATLSGGRLEFADMVGVFDERKLMEVLEGLLERGRTPVFASREGLETLLGRSISLGSELEEADLPMDLASVLGLEPRIRPGEIWALGGHRLACGDAMDPAAVRRLLGDEEIPLMVTDPPYGVELDHSWRRSASGKDMKSVRARGIEGDDNPDWREVWKLWQPQVVYVLHASQHAHLVREGLIEAGYELRQQLIWAKQPVLSRSYYQWAHEPIWFAVKRGKDARWKGDRTQSTVWHHRSPLAGGGSSMAEDEATAHATQKPVGVYEVPIRNHTEYGERVVDPFAGSGTLAIAAERTGRRALMMEVSPLWCEVAMQRWERYTGQECRRVDS